MDILHVKHRLRLAIAVVPLAALPFSTGCSKSPPAVDTKKPKIPTAAVDAGPDPSKLAAEEKDREAEEKDREARAQIEAALASAQAARKSEGHLRISGGCPSGELCAPKAELMPFMAGTEAAMGCPTSFDMKKVAETPLGKRPGGDK